MEGPAVLYSVDDIFPSDDEGEKPEEGKKQLELKVVTDDTETTDGPTDDQQRERKFYEMEYDDVAKAGMKSYQTIQTLKKLRFRTSLLWFLSALCVVLVIVLIIFISLYTKKSWRKGKPVHDRGTIDGPKSTPRGKNLEDEYCTSADCVIIASRMLETMNKSVDPCQDFSEYACGGWYANTLMPDHLNRFGRFAETKRENENHMKKILNDLISGKIRASTQPVKNAVIYYQACKNVRQIKRIGDSRMKEMIANDIGPWPVIGDDSNSTRRFNKSQEQILVDALVFASDLGADNVLNIEAGHDSKRVLFLSFGKPTLPMKEEYYVGSTTADIAKRTAYLKLMKAVATQMGAKKAGLMLMEEVFQFEMKLARLMSSKDNDSYTEISYENFMIQPYADPKLYMELIERSVLQGSRKLTPNTTFVLHDMQYMIKALKLFNELRWEVKLSRVIWISVKTMVEYLSGVDPYKYIWYEWDERDENRGEKPRWRSCIDSLNKVLGYALTPMFVERYFDERAKELSSEMIDGIKKAFRININELDWLDNTTKTYAKRKAADIIDNIGYPGMIFNETKIEEKYADLHPFKEGEFFLNIVEKYRFLTRLSRSQPFQIRDRARWTAELPIDTNAYYSNYYNKIIFPAGVLQWPLYDFRAPRAVNYGAVGMVVGHEISHGFDSKGKNYDMNGKKNPWMSSNSSKEFQKRSQCFIEQYDNVTTLYGYRTNGKLTLGEDIADNGGIRRAFEAYTQWVKENGREKKLIGLDLTPNQLFFFAFGQLWCDQMRELGVKWWVKNAVHSISPVRVRTVLSNFEEFGKAFKCPVGSPMNPKHKCRLW